MTRPVLIVCMGVSSCGKTTLGRSIAAKLNVPFFEADDFHSGENRTWMAAGKPLTDAMREPWIESICNALRQSSKNGQDAVLACSALRRANRQSFRDTGFVTRFLFLDGSRELIAGWIAERENHFMPPGLLDSQFDALESPVSEADVQAIRLDRPWPAIEDECLERARQVIVAGPD